MKKGTFIFIICLSLVFLVQNIEALPQYILTDPYSLPSGFGGGPFSVDPLPEGGTDNFVTFCVEKNEYFTPGQSYYGSIEDGAIFGGVGGQTSSGYDPLDVRTKYLYSYFLDNQSDILSDADKYTGLQLAIWRSEDEISNFNEYSGDILYWANYYYDMTIGTPKYNIMVLNLWGADFPQGGPYYSDYKRQSQLIRVPEPGILILLGTGLTVLGLASRRYRRI